MIDLIYWTVLLNYAEQYSKYQYTLYIYWMFILCLFWVLYANFFRKIIIYKSQKVFLTPVPLNFADIVSAKMYFGGPKMKMKSNSFYMRKKSLFFMNPHTILFCCHGTSGGQKNMEDKIEWQQRIRNRTS